MSADFTDEHVSVTLAGQQGFGPRHGASASRRERRDSAAAEVLSAHWNLRVRAAFVIAVIQLVVLSDVAGHPPANGAVACVVGTVVSYILLVAGIEIVVRRTRRATPWLVTLALFGDLVFIFALTMSSTTPAHYARALFGTIVVVHVANFFFGRRQAWRVVQLGIAGYLGLIISAEFRGLRIDITEELWTFGLCTAGLALIVLQAGDVRRRLRTIVQLFEKAEEGDFSREYDVAADGRPDAITRVGMAYNGVRAQLASMVLTDPLTGCLNRRGFDQAVAREVSRATRAGSEFALLAIDLDHFKEVNDTYGHLAGDVVLRGVGALLVNAARAGDVVARVGGEEFAVLLTDTGATGARLSATRLRERLSAHRFDIGDHADPVRLTTSIGLAVGSPSGDADFAESLWSRADDALYEAKRANRDCVRVWSEVTRRSGEYAAIMPRLDARRPAPLADC